MGSQRAVSAAEFDNFFLRAARFIPYPFQRHFALSEAIPELVSVPTGLGKTAMAVIGWLWRRQGADAEIRALTPRRLVYCLPMRVLVEQTRDNAVLWLHNLGRLDGAVEIEEENGKQRLRSYSPTPSESAKVAVHVLMGGEDEADWDLYPERDAIIVGTQDMLLSRALNRGYAATRSRWPVQFGLLNNDCLWVFDEVQLMGSGLATTAQLEAFRSMVGSKDGHGCRSVWMSATLRADWLETVDFEDTVRKLSPLQLSGDDRVKVKTRWQARKPLTKAKSRIGDPDGIAREIREAHRPGTRTIVVVNTVARACKLFEALSRPVLSAHAGKGRRAKRASTRDVTSAAAGRPSIPVVLLHSRFRPGERKGRLDQAIADLDPSGPGLIVVSTQVIEAGVDVSAATLFSELAPWASLVQRFGRCNRTGMQNEDARVSWIDLPETADDKPARSAAAPYERSQLAHAGDLLLTCSGGVGPAALERARKDHRSDFTKAMAFERTHVIRRTDLIELFDTTPDLAGNEIDIDRFVREIDDSDVRVFWREWDREKTVSPPADGWAPRPDELCPAPIGEFREFAKERGQMVWRWNFLARTWERFQPAKVAPGQVLLAHAAAGGYSDRGWDPVSREPVHPIPAPAGIAAAPDSNDDDHLSLGVWQTLPEHADDVCRELEGMLSALPSVGEDASALRAAARWHDRGKAHEVVQNAVDDGQVVERRGRTITRKERPSGWQGCRVIAKAPSGWWRRYDWLPKDGRKHFRHELASALAVLDPGNIQVPNKLRDLVAYLTAAHHGKVRLSIRSLPDERRPEPASDAKNELRRFARGIWDGDRLPAADLGGNIVAPAVVLSLEPMELGLCQQEPFAGQASWAERMIGLRDSLGPFRLAYLEGIVRAADMRASKAAEHRVARGSADVASDRSVDG